MATTSDDLIKNVRSARLRLLRPHPTPRPGVALVVHRQGHDPLTIRPNDRMTMGEVTWGRDATIYEVDVSEQSFDFECKLPCRSDAFEFHATAHVAYVVNDPAIIVANERIADGRALVERLLLRIMRAKSREFEVEESAKAEAAISKLALDTTHDPPTGLKVVRFAVELELEEDARTFIRKLKVLERNKEYELGQSELEKQRLALSQELEGMKLKFYGPLVRAGHWELLGLYLANNPEEVASVAKTLREQDAATLDKQLVFLKTLIDGDAVEGFQMEEATQRLLRSLMESLDSDQYRRALDAGSRPEAIGNGPDDADEESETEDK